MSISPFPDAIRQAIASQPDGIARVLDEQTNKTYLIVEQSRVSALYDHWLREQLQVGFNEADRGETAEWNLDEFLDKMHQQHSSKSVD